jgi:pimeloyl-ACP methyl ester carboxylesterase
MRLWAFALLAAPLLAEGKLELGTINGAQFRIDVPESWNGSLVVYCHGYNPKPVVYRDNPPAAIAQQFLDRGFAVAQSGYSAGGWAIAEAIVDSESLRRYFAGKYGAPKDTWITGHSMGGFLTMALMESFPTIYRGGLPLCGPLAAPSWFMARGAFDLKTIFDYFFPGVSTSSKVQEELGENVSKALKAEPAKAAQLRRMYPVKSERDLTGSIAFAIAIVAEIFDRAGGNPFDNRSIIYSGSDDDKELNAGVRRVAAHPKAAAYLRAFYTPTGKLAQPMLAVHTDYDAIVPAWIPNIYTEIAAQAGAADKFVQQYVRRDGHCRITPAETGRAFDELRAWVEKGERPPYGDRTIAQ